MKSGGTYLKGVAKREEILEKALVVIGREGIRGASVKEIADAVHLSPAGVLHHFGTKEELFTEILRKRDELDEELFEAGEPADQATFAYLDLTRRNALVPGLIELFSRLAVEATDPNHPAHEFFVQRGSKTRAGFEEVIRSFQENGQLPLRSDPAILARVMQAVSDGLQIQWLLDPSIDMAGIMADLFADLLGGNAEPGTEAAE
jgi:AcrR family transcriptional regulator